MSMTTYRNVRVYKPSSSRYIGIAFVVLLHIVLVIFLLHVLGVRTFEAPPPDIVAKNIDIAKPKDEVPPPPPPDFKIPPPPFVPPPDVVIQTNAPAPANAISVTTVKPVAAPPPPPPPAPAAPKATTLPRLTRALDTERWYPAISKRLNEEGIVQLQIYVGVDGRIEQAKVAKSSGYDRLDKAALSMAMGGGIPALTPGTEDGKPAAMWHTIGVRFNIAN
jgi:protein TonB